MSTILEERPVAPPAPSPAGGGRAERHGGRPSFARRLLRGRPEDPRWVRPGLIGLLLATAVLYLWGLGASGWANSFYSAAVQAGSASWKAFFFGSSDAANSITVDKTPASLWAMALSVRVFGLSSWSILVPQALMGVATVGVLYAGVRRWFGPGAGLMAGAMLALTPVATLMFRFNNPDAMLVLLLTLGAYAVIRALEVGQTRAGTRWMLAAGAFVGFAFLAKMLQALLVVPAFALVYLLFAPTGIRRRLFQLLAAGAAMIASAGWYIATVELIPASMRPYIGGSQTNSILELTLGYNGLGRLSGNETGSVGGGQGGGWGETGLLRMFNAEMGGQIAWLLPAALAATVVGLIVTARRGRTDRQRAAFTLWGGWLLVTGLIFSLMQGIFHAYYTVALAPAVAALVAMAASVLWARRERLWASGLLAAGVAGTSVWAWVLLGRSADFLPWLRPVILVAGIAAAFMLAAGNRVAPKVGGVVAAAALVAVLAGPAAYAVQTAATAHTGSIVTAGPTVAGAQGGPGGGPGGRGGPGGGGQPPQGMTPPGQGTAGQGTTGTTGQRGGPGGGMGGLLNGSTASAELTALLQQDADSYTWTAAAVGANNAAGYQLASEEPVMAIGGFNGSDPSPTLAQFQQYVAEGRIHYFIASGGGMQSDSGSSASQEIAAWVQETYTATTVDGTTVYDLTTTS
jgi:4-amino-4-deoxy-L-arabinose transferase-like glycosyltransferase